MPIILEPSAYGATAGTGDNTTALQAWWNALMTTAGARGEIAGNYPYASPYIWDFALRPARVRIDFIDGVGALHYTGTAAGSKGLTMINSAGTSRGAIGSVVDVDINGLEIYSDHDGITFQSGSDNNFDVFESSRISDARVLNYNSAGISGAITARAVRLVGNNEIEWGNPIFGCKPALNNTTDVGSGIALELVQVVGNNFISPSIGNAAIAVRYADLGVNYLGFTHGNKFDCPDIENARDGFYADCTASGALNGEEYEAGNIDLVGGGYPMAVKNGAGFVGGSIPSKVMTWVAPPWHARTSGVLINTNTGFSSSGISVIVS